MKFWRRISTPTTILWLLIILLAVGVSLVACAWELEPGQILSAAIAALAIPLAFLTQRAILMENQKQKLRIDAYNNLQQPLDQVRDALISVTVSSLDQGATRLAENNISTKQAAANFIYAYNTYEMAFNKVDVHFKYIYLLLMKLSRELDYLAQEADAARMGVLGYTGDDADDLIKYQEARELADDIKAYIYDLKKECIEALGFSKLFNTSVERRVVKDEKHKTLPEVATKKEIKHLTEELGL